MKKQIITILLALYFLSANAFAQDSAFNYQAELSQGKQSIREFKIPFTVYEQLKSSNHNDLRIFDANGTEMPSSIRFPQEQNQQNETTERLHFFIKPKLAKSAFNRYNGNEIALSSTLFIENKNTDLALKHLIIDWKNAGKSTTLSLHVKASDDMSTWRSIPASDYLYDLQHLGQHLKNNTISLEQASHAKFLAIQFTGSENGLASKVTQVHGTYQENQTTKNPSQAQQIQQLTHNTKDNEILFSIPASLKIKSITIEPPYSTGLYTGRLYSGLTKPANSKRQQLKQRLKDKLKHNKSEQSQHDSFNWQYEADFSQYKIVTKTGTLHSAATSLSQINRQQQWKAVFTQPQPLSKGQLPTVSYTWQAATVRFLAQGKEPFTVRFGKQSELVNRPLLGELQDISPAEVVTLADIVQIKPPPINNEEPVTKQDFTWALWLVLAIGLILMGFIAYRVITSKV